VKNSIVASGWPSTAKRRRAPSERPIQFRCAAMIGSGHSMPSNLSSSSAYAVILKNHCVRSFFTTAVPQRSQRPLMTCSFASTVSSFGHQFAGAAAR